jgi:hypothetical protein
MKRLLLKLMLCFVGMLNLNCEPAIEPVRKFTIQKGKHYSTERLVESLQGSTLSFSARFDNTAVYDLQDIALQTNKNKLLGFSDCNSLHHENSARFAWQWFNNKLEIYAYCYVNSKRVEKFIGTAELNSFSDYKIECTATEYVFYLNNESPVRIARASSCRYGLYYMLWPYFGGSVPAPHDVNIEIKML